MSRKYRNNNEVYIVGSNAAKLERYYEPDRTQLNETVDSKNVNKRQAQRRAVNRYKYKMKFALILSVTMVMCLVMIKTQFTVADRSDNIVRLENKLNELKKNNRLIEESIHSTINLEQVYEIATTKLGMVMPSKTQVNNFAIAEGSYTQQFSEITQTVDDTNDISGIFGFILSKGR